MFYCSQFTKNKAIHSYNAYVKGDLIHLLCIITGVGPLWTTGKS